MTRTVTLAGYVVLGSAVVLYQLAAWRSRRAGLARRHLMLGELLDAVMWGPARWLVLAGWLWVGWHVFVRVHWR
ncbi:MAG: hypothetical protein ACRDGJ_01720 [Candidatus Limnocylindria bacterium]